MNWTQVEYAISDASHYRYENGKPVSKRKGWNIWQAYCAKNGYKKWYVLRVWNDYWAGIRDVRLPDSGHVLIQIFGL